MSSSEGATPTISVCLASHNGGRFIREQLESILAQLRSTDELIVVDDASTDDTVAIVHSFEDPRIRVTALTQNIGYVAAFAQALATARNELILLSDQDDVWLPGRVQSMVKGLGQKRVVAGNLTTLDGPASIPGPYGQRNWRLDPSSSDRTLCNTVGVLTGNRPYFGSAMGLRREALEVILPFPQGLRESHDLWIALCGIQLGALQHLPCAVTARRYHDTNATPANPRGPLAVLRSRILILRLIGEARSRARSQKRVVKWP